jgi:hypothetical protein
VINRKTLYWFSIYTHGSLLNSETVLFFFFIWEEKLWKSFVFNFSLFNSSKHSNK